MTKNELIRYWTYSADKDQKAMESLLKNGHYAWSLFFGHLVIEKLLKAFYVKNKDSNVLFIHDLTKIAERANLKLTEEQKNFLDEVTTFNIKTRYPDYKLRFYKKVTKIFALNYITKIKGFKKWLIKQLKE